MLSLTAGTTPISKHFGKGKYLKFDLNRFGITSAKSQGFASAKQRNVGLISVDLSVKLIFLRRLIFIMSLDRFMKVFSSLPLEERNQIIVVIGGQPITWNMAYSEIRHRTKLGDDIQKKLVSLDII